VEQTQFTRQPDGLLIPSNVAIERDNPTQQDIICRYLKIYTVWHGLQSESQLNVWIQQALAEH
jgi:hypothetical protein